MKQQKPWFDEKYIKLLQQWKQAKLQSLQNPNKINADYLNNARSENRRTCRKKRGNI
jgi:hypothetical protein